MVVKTRPHYFRGENETIKKWYLFPDLGVVNPTNKKAPFMGVFLLGDNIRDSFEPTRVGSTTSESETKVSR
jgi:hypothetical protein